MQCYIKVQDVSKLKSLGIIIDNNLTFKDNTIYVISKVAKKLNILY